MIELHATSAWITTFAAVLARVAAFVIAAPILGQNVIPARVRLLLIVAIAASLVSVAPAPALDAGRAPLSVAFGLVLEALVGALLGFVARLVFDAVSFAAEAISISMGLGSASLFDPMLGQQGSVLTLLEGQVAVALFVALDGHHVLFEVLGRSLQAVPLLTPHIGPGLAWGLVQVVTTTAAAGLALAAPVLTTLLLFQTGLAVLTRAVPSLGSFASMGFLATVAVGLLLLQATHSHWLQAVAGLIDLTGRQMNAAFGALATP